MKPHYDPTLLSEIRNRMSLPSGERVAGIASSTGITTQTLNNWRGWWQKVGQLMLTTSNPQEQWSVADKLAAMSYVYGFMLECAPGIPSRT